VSRQTAVAIAAVVGLAAGLGITAGVVLALREDDGDELSPVASETDIIDTGTGEVVVTEEPEPPPLETIEVGGFPNAVDVGARGVWVVRDGRRVIRINPATREVAARIGAGDELGSERPCGIATGEGGVWVATLSGNVARINPATNRATRLIETEEAACVAAGRSGVWVTRPNAGEVVRIDPLTNEIVAEIPLEGFPQGIAVGFGSVWVAASDPPDGANGGISRIDPRSNEVVRTILVPNLPEFVATGAGAVWVTSNNGTIAELDPRTNQVVATIRITEGGRTIVAVGGGAVWAAEISGPGEDASVVRIDPETAEVTGEPIAVGRNALGLAFGAGALWVTNYDDGTVTRYEPPPG
jgi:streptogramin lyase